ncbi:hypothetical protein BN13_420057 [Nostocoides jenkinsii Ben 74]|uniref:Uncharacterized protein n=1 Tax=Nostocoides jenkinsii Ben 74 TaxID=1193518 RepID=A0A077MEZ4_9MICO|nr:hypothetical protein BN13_420057 [Tetrasphaera jenkinsii Ben 74]
MDVCRDPRNAAERGGWEPAIRGGGVTVGEGAGRHTGMMPATSGGHELQVAPRVVT